MKRSIRAALVLAVLLAADAPAQDTIPRIVDVRIGQHRDFDRVVLELDQAAPITRQPTAPGQDVVIDLGARPLLPRQEIATGSPRFQSMLLEGTVEGARLQLQRGQARVRVFWLTEPPRLVIDVADEGEAPFEPPPGTQSLDPPPSEPIEAIPPLPEVTREIPEEELPLREQLEALGAADPMPETPLPEEVEPEEAPVALAPTEAPTQAADVPAEPPPEQVAPPVGLPPQPLPPELAPLPMPPTKPEGTAPGERRSDRWLSLLIWVGLPLLLIGLALYLTRARGRGVEEAPEPRPPESITPGEVMSASDRLDLLEKRIDEEVRARMQLEHRVVMVQEDLKVVRDRVIRMGRRGEAPS
jgi:hypothetical protein